MRTISITAYEFEELSEEAQKKVLRRMQDINVDYEWWETVYDDAGSIGLKIEEFDLGRRFFVKGTFTQDAEDVANNIIAEHGEACDTVKTAKDFLVELQKAKDACKKAHLNAVFDQSPCRANDSIPILDENWEDFLKTADIKEEFRRSLCEDYRIILQKEYEYLLSDESIIETIKANEYEFTESGKLI